MRVLTFSSLFPNPSQPNLGLFVAERLKYLRTERDVRGSVVAPIPWFPSKRSIFGTYAKFAEVPSSSRWQGETVLHPKYAIIPGPGWYLTPFTMALGTFRAVRGLRNSAHDFDLIDAHYFYPDGVAAALLALWFDKPLVITARGTDINLIPKYPLARRMIRWAAHQADACIAVSEAIRDEMVVTGIDQAKITVLRNGVDLDRFHPIDRLKSRERFGVSGKTLLSVGYLIERKGHHVVIEAMRYLPEWRLIIVGDGDWNQRLRELALRLGVHDRVAFVGSKTQSELVEFYNAADALVLASSREGMPNVVLEAIACGTPVVATALWGTPEVIKEPVAGQLMHERTAQAVAQAVRRLEGNPPSRGEVRRYAEQFSWESTTAGQVDIFCRVVEKWRARVIH